MFTGEEISDAATPTRDRGLSRNFDVPSNESEPRKPHLRLVQGGNACIKEGNTHVNGCASVLKLGIQWHKLETNVNNANHSRRLETLPSIKCKLRFQTIAIDKVNPAECVKHIPLRESQRTCICVA